MRRLHAWQVACTSIQMVFIFPRATTKLRRSDKVVVNRGLQSVITETMYLLTKSPWLAVQGENLLVWFIVCAQSATPNSLLHLEISKACSKKLD